MKNTMKLLDAIGQIQDVYVLEAHSTHKKHNGRIGLIAAVAAVLLLLAGCAAIAWNWYDGYFAQKRQEPLSESQLDYIHRNAVDYQVSQTYGGYTLELKSTIAERNTAYVTFHLTAPENVDLSPVVDVRTEERLSFRGLVAIPENSTLPADLGYEVIDDGDGKNNTVNVVLRIQPMVQPDGEPAFGPGKQCSILFKEIVYNGYDREYAQQQEKPEQNLGMLTPEESSRLHPQDILVSGNWEFTVELREADDGSRELLSEPMATKAMVTRTGANEYEAVDAVETVQLTSVRIHPLSMEIAFEQPEPRASFEGLYLDVSQAVSPGTDTAGYSEILLFLKDGTKIHFFQYDGAKECAVLKADSPIVLSEIDCLQLSDGTVIRAQ